jgi:hypothetical protein
MFGRPIERGGAEPSSRRYSCAKMILIAESFRL